MQQLCLLSLLGLTEKLAHSHVTIGAIDCGDTWMYSDGEMGPDASDTGRLSLDLPMVENYNTDLAAHATAIAAGGSYDQQLRQWPMAWEPIVNCPYYESANQMGLEETNYLP